MNATVKTGAVILHYKDADGNTWSKTLSGMKIAKMGDAAQAKTFAESYSKIVDGTLIAVELVVTTPVEVD